MKRYLGGACALALAATLAVVVSNEAGHHADPIGRRTVVLGRSVDGRAIRAIEVGDLDSLRKALVVGCIHGNECAGIAVAAVGAAGLGVIGEKPELTARALIFVGLAEGIAIYGLIIAIMILTRI